VERVLTAIYALSCLASGTVNAPEAIVFPATRYHWRGRHVYPSGSSHLYSVRLDGSDLHQLTFGSSDDNKPLPTPDGRHIVFLRSRQNSDQVAICSTDLDGRVIQKLAVLSRDEPAILSEARILAGRPLPYKLKAYGPDNYALLNGSGQVMTRLQGGFEIQFSPDWTCALLYQNRLVDLQTGSQIELSSRGSSIEPGSIVSWAWLDGSTLIGEDLGRDEALLVNRSGKILRDLKTESAVGPKHREHGNDFEDQEGLPEGLDRAMNWPNHPGSAITWNVYGYSSGSAGKTSILNLSTGALFEVDDQRFYGVTQDGRHLVTGTWEWQGGYHEPGSAGLDRLYVWDTRTWESKQIGFKWMKIRSDACIVGGNRSSQLQGTTSKISGRP